MKKIYYKVYQDNESVPGPYFVSNWNDIQNNISDWIKTAEDQGCSPPCFEPIEMTEEQFENLPEFKGY